MSIKKTVGAVVTAPIVAAFGQAFAEEIDVMMTGLKAEDARENHALFEGGEPNRPMTEREWIERILRHTGEGQAIMPLAHPKGNQDVLRYYTFMDDFIFFLEDAYQRAPERFNVPSREST